MIHRLGARDLLFCYPRWISSPDLCYANEVELDDPDYFHPVMHKVDALGYFIDFIHNKFPYTRYDYFPDKFVYYKEGTHSKDYYAEQRIYVQASDSSVGLIALTQSWFPNVPCTDSAKLKGDMIEEIRNYLTKGNWLDGKRDI